MISFLLISVRTDSQKTFQSTLSESAPLFQECLKSDMRNNGITFISMIHGEFLPLQTMTKIHLMNLIRNIRDTIPHFTYQQQSLGLQKNLGNILGTISRRIGRHDFTMTTNSSAKKGNPATSGQVAEIARKAPILFTGSASNIIFLMSAWGTLNGMGKYVADPTPANLRIAVKEFKATLQAKSEKDKAWREAHPIKEVTTS